MAVIGVNVLPFFYWLAGAFRPSVLSYVVQIFWSRLHFKKPFADGDRAAAVWSALMCTLLIATNSDCKSKRSKVPIKPAGLDLLWHVISFFLYSIDIVSFTIPTKECGCIIKSSKSLCQLVLTSAIVKVIYDTRMKYSVCVAGDVKHIMDIVSFVLSYHL